MLLAVHRSSQARKDVLGAETDELLLVKPICPPIQYYASVISLLDGGLEITSAWP
jgi:hypothetical protein